jgi:hypothetical protein
MAPPSPADPRCRRVLAVEILCTHGRVMSGDEVALLLEESG